MPGALVEPAAQVDSEPLRPAAEAVRTIDTWLATGKQAERIVDVIRAAGRGG